jgi:hypothetical protein
MTTESRLRAKAFMNYGNEVPRRVCPCCGWRLYTRVGLESHMATEHPGEPVPEEPRPEPKPKPKPKPEERPSLSEEARATLRASGLRLSAQMNARRRRCDTCGMESTAAAMGMHLKASRHCGWSEVTAA